MLNVASSSLIVGPLLWGPKRTYISTNIIEECPYPTGHLYQRVSTGDRDPKCRTARFVCEVTRATGRLGFKGIFNPYFTRKLSFKFKVGGMNGGCELMS